MSYMHIATGLIGKVSNLCKIFHEQNFKNTKLTRKFQNIINMFMLIF